MTPVFLTVLVVINFLSADHRHIVDCLLSDIPLNAIAQLTQLETLILSRNIVSKKAQDAPLSVLSQVQFEFLRARLSGGESDDGRRETPCPDGSSSEQLNGLKVCVAGANTDVMSIQRRMLVTNSTSNLRKSNSTSNSSGSGSSDTESATTVSIYLIASFAGPGLFALYKLFLYVYFYTTYAKHLKNVQIPAENSKNDSAKGDDDNEDPRTTEKVSSSISPDSLVFAVPPESIVLPPAPADQRRFNNMSFWVDEELQDWRMDFNQVKMLKCLTTTPNQKRHLRSSNPATAALSACEVWLGKFYPQGAPDAEQNVVLKWLPPKHKEPNNSPMDKFKGEIKRQAQFSHPNVVKFFGIVWSVDTHLVAVTEYMARGDLRQWLHRYATRESGRWSVQKVQILLDVAKALLYLHSMRPTLVHGNCNSRNVLLNERMKAKLSDFGSSKDLLSERELMAYSAVGSGRWISPEALVGRESKVSGYNTGAGDAAAAADVYSLGILMSEMDTHELPFSDLMQANKAALPETDVLQLIAKGALSPTLSPTCHPGIGKLIEGCTAFSPKNRPSSRTVVHSLQEIVQQLKDETQDGSDSDDEDGDVHLTARSIGVVV